jgi:hypothetical protein
LRQGNAVTRFFFTQKERIRSDFEPLFTGSSSGKPVSKGYKDFCNKWGWYKTIADLAEDKIYLFDQITGKAVVEVFGFLLYRIDKAQAEEEQYKFEKQIRR